MEEMNSMNLDELLNSTYNKAVSETLYEKADVDVSVKKDDIDESQMSISDYFEQDTENEDKEMTKQEFAELNRKKAMEKLEEYEAEEKKIIRLDGEMTLLNQELEYLISKIKQENKELIDKINDKANEIEAAKAMQESIKQQLLPLQREVYLADNEDKTLVFNKIQSTYVAATEKNQFDLKKFREEQKDFWKENLEVMQPYAKITAVSDYIKITISKK